MSEISSFVIINLLLAFAHSCLRLRNKANYYGAVVPTVNRYYSSTITETSKDIMDERNVYTSSLDNRYEYELRYPQTCSMSCGSSVDMILLLLHSYL